MSQNPEVERLSDDDVFDDEESELSKVDDDFFQDFTVSPVKGPQTQSKNYVFLWKGAYMIIHYHHFQLPRCKTTKSFSGCLPSQFTPL